MSGKNHAPHEIKKSDTDHTGATQTFGWDLWKIYFGKFPTRRYNESSAEFHILFCKFHSRNPEWAPPALSGAGRGGIKQCFCWSSSFKGGREDNCTGAAGALTGAEEVGNTHWWCDWCWCLLSILSERLRSDLQQPVVVNPALSRPLTGSCFPQPLFNAVMSASCSRVWPSNVNPTRAVFIAGTRVSLFHHRVFIHGDTHLNAEFRHCAEVYPEITGLFPG